MDFIFVYITTKDRQQAREIGTKLVEERLVACVNIVDGMESIYWWQGSLNQDRETVLIAKTRKALLDTVVDRVKQLHTYDCPCVVALPLVGGNPEYLQWLENETENMSK